MFLAQGNENTTPFHLLSFLCLWDSLPFSKATVNEVTSSDQNQEKVNAAKVAAFLARFPVSDSNLKEEEEEGEEKKEEKCKRLC